MQRQSCLSIEAKIVDRFEQPHATAACLSIDFLEARPKGILPISQASRDYRNTPYFAYSLFVSFSILFSGSTSELFFSHRVGTTVSPYLTL